MRKLILSLAILMSLVLLVVSSNVVSAETGEPTKLTNSRDQVPFGSRSVVAHNGRIYFTTYGWSGLHELWMSNGTTGGTNPVGTLRSRTITLHKCANKLFVITSDGLWTINGQNWTLQLNEKPVFYTGESNGQCFFAEFESSDGSALPTIINIWKSNGTRNGTSVVHTFSGFDQSVGVGQVTQLNRNQFAVVLSGDNRNGTSEHGVWLSNGTRFTKLFEAKEVLGFTGGQFFAGSKESNGRSRWGVYNVGGQQTQDMTGVTSYPSWAFVLNGRFFFVASETFNDTSYLWSSDGTRQGTTKVTRLPSGKHGEPIVYNGRLYFAQISDAHGFELWTSDGTTNGTYLVADIYPGRASSYPSDLQVVNGHFYFTAVDHIHGEELWRSNGTAEGTVRLTDIDKTGRTFERNDVLQAANIGNSIFFMAHDGRTGYQLFKLDPNATAPSAGTSPADNGSCAIPESGPWPPCASNGTPVSGDCAIPESGPWPPCATAGTPPANDCAIPESGPWPPCARNREVR